MYTFIAAIVILVLGYAFYGKLAQKVFNVGDGPTPAVTMEDGVDFMPMSSKKVFLIQLLNIAGTGPIFGALMGACFGEVVLLWIVFGTILAGAIHDYYSGMISLKRNGCSIVEIVGEFLGSKVKAVMIVFSIILLVLVGTVFMTTPAALLGKLTEGFLSAKAWLVIILVYYVLATILPIDKIIGKIYPLFGAVLIFMAVGLVGGLFVHGYTLPEISFVDKHPAGLPVWPYMFITVACGAISGFHSTQSPLMARCLKQEKHGRQVFYGAMVAEGVIALIWAQAGIAFYHNTDALYAAISAVGQSGVVYEILHTLLGPVGGALAVIGVVACPITSGDTAFRSARLILADALKWDQKKLNKRLIVAVPLLAVGMILSQLDFAVIWRYFSWSNQTLAMVALWAAATYLSRNADKFWYSLIAAVPAAFMSALIFTYMLMSKSEFYLGLSASIAYPAGIIFAAVLSFIFWKTCAPKKNA